MVKTWAGQSNLRMGIRYIVVNIPFLIFIRYGVAESKNTRVSMEDRTVAKPSIEGDAK